MDIIKKIQEKFDGTQKSLQAIRQNMRHHGMTLKQWKDLRDYALREHEKARKQNSKPESRLIQYLLFANKRKRLTADDIGRIMAIVRDENKQVRTG